jgi:hypothetical protein
MVDRVHGHAAVVRTTTLPADTTGLAPLDVDVLGVANLADGGAAVEVHLAHLARGQTQAGPVAVLGHQGDDRAGRAAELGPAADLELDAVHVGASLLVARRLVEVGVPFVSVHQEIFRHYGHAYDMHENNFGMLKNFNLPILDQVYPALIQDLDGRGLLDSTLVIVMGEMGRTPRVNGKAGRDHWPQCGFSLLTGGGVKAGMVHGATDKQAAYPVSHPVSPANLVATIYHLLGVDPHLTVPGPIAQGGEPVQGVLA